MMGGRCQRWRGGFPWSAPASLCLRWSASSTVPFVSAEKGRVWAMGHCDRVQINLFHVIASRTGTLWGHVIAIVLFSPHSLATSKPPWSLISVRSVGL